MPPPDHDHGMRPHTLVGSGVLVCLFAFAEPDRRLHGVRLAPPNGKSGHEVHERANAG